MQEVQRSAGRGGATATSWVLIGYAAVGVLLLGTGGVLAQASTKSIHDWGATSYDTAGSRIGLILAATGGLVLCSLAIVSALMGLINRFADTRASSDRQEPGHTQLEGVAR